MGAHLVERTDARRLALKVAVELLETGAPEANVRLNLMPLFVTELQRELRDPWLGLLELFAHARALPFQDLAQILLFPLATFPERLDRECRHLMGARLQLRQEIGDVAGRGGEELALDGVTGRVAARVNERGLEECECLGFRLARVGRERPLPEGRLDPASRQWYQLLVEPLG